MVLGYILFDTITVKKLLKHLILKFFRKLGYEITRIPPHAAPHTTPYAAQYTAPHTFSKHGTYFEVFKEHNDLVSHKGINYFFIYDRLFKRFIEKGKPIVMLEIGVQNGGSLEIWKKYFPQGSIIHGIDVNVNCQQLNFNENIYFHLGDAADHRFLNNTFSNIKFDIIIDDGSHISKDVIHSFENLFPKMNYGGCYIVEDMGTSYWKNYGGGIGKKGSSIEYFKRLIDYGLYSNIFSKYLTSKKFDSSISDNIAEIRFFEGICAIDKFYEPNEVSKKDVITGQIGSVCNMEGIVTDIKNVDQIEIYKTMKLFCG